LNGANGTNDANGLNGANGTIGSILDLGMGSGCIVVNLAKHLPEVKIADIYEAVFVKRVGRGFGGGSGFRTCPSPSASVDRPQLSRDR
jgi:hypothetical protein